MKKPAPLICLLTPGHLASTPRLLKEADALIDAGYRVHVVSGRHYTPAEPLDAGVLATARWASTQVDFARGAAVFGRKVLRRISRSLVSRAPFGQVTLAARTHHAESLHFGAVAARIPADFYLGHCLAALPAVAYAAEKRGVPYGFDIEDYHDGETLDSMGDRAEMTARRILQSTLLPGCAHLTAAAPLIAAQYVQHYGVHPFCVLNVFPRSEGPSAPVDPGPITERRPARLYWFSQTIGKGRGLEAVIAAMARMRTPVELHLRGIQKPGYGSCLQGLATELGLKYPIQFLSPGPAAEMARLAANADLGLSTEETLPLNRDVCLTNKIFTYLLAGIPQLLSATVAQSAIAPELGNAGLLGDLDRPDEIARKLDVFFGDPTRVAMARSTAWELGHGKYCWDTEKDKFLASMRGIVPLKPPAT